LRHALFKHFDMNDSSRQRLTAVLAGSIVTTGMGWVMISETTGTTPTNRFLYTGFAIALAVTAVDTWLHRKGSTRALHRLLSRGTIVFLLMWFMSCLLLPLFWIDEVDGRTKLAAIGLLSWLCGANAIRGFRQFRAAWASRGAAALAEHYQEEHGTIEWDWTVDALRIEPTIYVPLMNRFTIPLAVVSGLGGFMFGPSLVYSYPVVAALGWTFAMSVFIAYFVQLLGSGAAQALTLAHLEWTAGRPLAPMYADEALRPLRRKRKSKKR
jgi:hypothetical protein